MSKFTVEYTRVIRLAKYETLKIGLVEEFNKNEITYGQAFEGIRNTVNFWIINEKKRLGL